MRLFTKKEYGFQKEQIPDDKTNAIIRQTTRSASKKLNMKITCMRIDRCLQCYNFSDKSNVHTAIRRARSSLRLFLAQSKAVRPFCTRNIGKITHWSNERKKLFYCQGLSSGKEISAMAEKYNTSTHLVLEILVGAGIQQQSRALHVTLVGGPHQRRVIVLRA